MKKPLSILAVLLVASLALGQGLLAKKQSIGSLNQADPATGGGGGGPCDSVNDSSLKAYWKLDEASGNATDSKGANTLTETGGTIDTTTGKISDARDFEDSDSEYFEIADNTDLSAGDIDFTFAAWVKVEAIGVYPVVAGKGWSNPLTTSSEWVVYLDVITGKMAFSVCQGTTPDGLQADNGGNISVGVWYHVCVWHDAVNNLIGIAINGGTPNTQSYSAGVNDGTGSFKMGADPSQTLYWDGLIDEAFFTKRILTSDERTALYNSGDGCRPGGL